VLRNTRPSIALLAALALGASAFAPPTVVADDVSARGETATDRGTDEVPSARDARPGRAPVGSVHPRDAARTLVVGADADLTRLRRHPHVGSVEHDPGLDRYIVGTSDVASLSRDLAADGVDSDPVFVIRVTDLLEPAPAVPSDPFYRHHSGAHLSELPYGLGATRWLGEGPIVAVLDTGVAPHPELGDRLLPGADLIEPGGDGRVDPHGHGTMTALTVAAAADDGRGSTGSCPRCRILPIRVLGEDGGGTSTTLAKGIQVAVDLGADIINISAGGPRNGGSTSYEDAVVAAATAAQVPILASAGNDGTTRRHYPAAIDGVIAVAGATDTGARDPNSTYGSWVDVAAPWCSVVGNGSSATYYCGTSAAAPFASGLVALRRATVGAEPVPALRSHLLSSGHPVSWVAGGRLDACAVVRSDEVRAEPTLDGWSVGADPSEILVHVAHPCGAAEVTVGLAGSSQTRTFGRAVGRLAFPTDLTFDLGAISLGETELTVTTKDALGRVATVTRNLTITEAEPATTDPALDDEPVEDEPTEPVVDDPLVDEPVEDDPVVDEPVRRFDDVAPGSTHEGAIYWLAERGITGGCNSAGDRYCPSVAVTRAQMASFLRSALGLPAGPTDVFTDVSSGSAHAASIGSMREADITRGCDAAGTRYCPGTDITRAQMAAFLQRALGLEVPADPHRFDDLPAGARHADAVAALHAAGITGGCDSSGQRFCPDAPVTRAQMATFLRNALQG
jgi:hypothetical protein